YILIVLRALQAAGGAGITPAATGIIVKHFGHARDRYVSLFGTIFPTGAMIGPIFGGLIVTYFSWQWIFFVNVPIGVMAIILALLFIPRDEHKVQSHETIDPRGIILLGIGLFTAMLAASYLGEDNSSPLSPLFIAPVLIAVAAFWMFFRHINHAEKPFILPQLIYGKGFGAINLVTMVCVGMAQGIIALIPLYAANRYGLSALDAGTLLIAEGIAAISLSIVATFWLRRSGYHLPLHIGASVVALGILLLAVHPFFGLSPYLWLALATFLVGVGAGTFSPASRNAGLQLAVEHSETIAAIRTIDLQIGTIITVSVATAIIAASHDSGIAQAWFHVGTVVVLLLAQLFVAYVPE
ncbi:MAG TPA: MFS transporter, partial [Candidatus Saccharimonadaceae bacterium]|nr:MFS transporter [Candidatus Saccharimonadaceae bacterium]